MGYVDSGTAPLVDLSKIQHPKNERLGKLEPKALHVEDRETSDVVAMRPSRLEANTNVRVFIKPKQSLRKKSSRQRPNADASTDDMHMNVFNLPGTRNHAGNSFTDPARPPFAHPGKKLPAERHQHEISFRKSQGKLVSGAQRPPRGEPRPPANFSPDTHLASTKRKTLPKRLKVSRNDNVQHDETFVRRVPGAGGTTASVTLPSARLPRTARFLRGELGTAVVSDYRGAVAIQQTQSEDSSYGLVPLPQNSRTRHRNVQRKKRKGMFEESAAYVQTLTCIFTYMYLDRYSRSKEI